MNIEICTELLPPDPKWQWSPTNPLQGTTKFYVRVAEELAKREHSVTVLYAGPEQQHNGVAYRPRDRFSGLWPDLVLDCNSQREAVPFERATRFQWTSFYNRPDTCVGEGYDRLFLVSSFVHSTLAAHVKCPVTVLELGCEYPTDPNPNSARRPKVCCYTSSPDRGGTFLKSIWPDVQAATGYHLDMSPYGEDFSAKEMEDLYRHARFWLYPATGTDSIISALEAQALGCIPFVVPHMGLPETLRYGVTTDLFRFKEDLIATLKADDTLTMTNRLMDRSAALKLRPIPSWSDVVDNILRYV